MPGAFRYEGYAIVSADGMIADADGRMPPALQNPADQRFFSEALDRAAVLVHGRHSHEGHRNSPRRRRVVAHPPRRSDRRRPGIAAFACCGTRPARRSPPPARRSDSPAERRRSSAGPRSTRCFSSSATIGFCSAAPPGCSLPGGLPIFGRGRLPVDEALAAAGLTPAEPRWLDREAGVSLTAWRKAAD